MQVTRQDARNDVKPLAPEFVQQLNPEDISEIERIRDKEEDLLTH